MNSRNRMLERNKIVQLIRADVRTGSRCNWFKYNPAYTDNHEDTKYFVFKELRKRGIDAWCEVIFENGSRADLMAFNPESGDSLIIEILYNETLEEANIKTLKYPDLNKIYIDAKKPFNKDDLYI